MNLKVKGTILGIVSAVSYGTNPLGALFLYQEGLNSNSVLFYRFSLAAVVLACILFIQKQSFIIRKTKCSSVLKQNVLFRLFYYSFYKTKRTYVNLFSYPNWHKKAPKKYAFFGAFLFGHITPKTRTNI